MAWVQATTYFDGRIGVPRDMSAAAAAAMRAVLMEVNAIGVKNGGGQPMTPSAAGGAEATPKKKKMFGLF